MQKQIQTIMNSNLRTYSRSMLGLFCAFLGEDSVSIYAPEHTDNKQWNNKGRLRCKDVLQWL